VVWSTAGEYFNRYLVVGVAGVVGVVGCEMQVGIDIKGRAGVWPGGVASSSSSSPRRTCFLGFGRRS